MRTLVFCTSYCDHADVWEQRIAFWISSIKASRIEAEQILVVDDASPVLPDWEGVEVIYGDELNGPRSMSKDSHVLIITHRNRLGRNSIEDFPGWWRSFCMGARYGIQHGYDRIIHIESDAHIVSERLATVINNTLNVWMAPWCKKYSFPEISIQVATGTGIDRLAKFIQTPYSEIRGYIHEYIFPFSLVDKTFLGDRYGEDCLQIPKNADFSNQTSIRELPEFYWWLKEAREQRVGCKSSVLFLDPPFSLSLANSGWGKGEIDHQWMIWFDSSCVIPAIHSESDVILRLGVRPCVHGTVKSQRLIVIINDQIVGEYAVFSRCEITCFVSRGIFRSSEENTLRFLHPDNFVPSLEGGSSETRSLAIALEHLSLLSD